MKVLIVGSGGREHALAWKCAQSPGSPRCSSRPAMAARHRSARAQCRRGGRGHRRPGGAGQGRTRRTHHHRTRSTTGRGRRRRIPGRRSALLRPAPGRAQLEGSKAFTKEFLKRHGIPDGGLRHVHAGTPSMPTGCAGSARPSWSRPPAWRPARAWSSSTAAEKPSPRRRPCLAGNSARPATRSSSRNSCRARKPASSSWPTARHILTMATSQDHKRLRDARPGPEYRRHGRLFAGTGGHARAARTHHARGHRTHDPRPREGRYALYRIPLRRDHGAP